MSFESAQRLYDMQEDYAANEEEEDIDDLPEIGSSDEEADYAEREYERMRGVA